MCRRTVLAVRSTNLFVPVFAFELWSTCETLTPLGLLSQVALYDFLAHLTVQHLERTARDQGFYYLCGALYLVETTCCYYNPRRESDLCPRS